MTPRRFCHRHVGQQDLGSDRGPHVAGAPASPTQGVQGWEPTLPGEGMQAANTCSLVCARGYAHTCAGLECFGITEGCLGICRCTLSFHKCLVLWSICCTANI